VAGPKKGHWLKKTDGYGNVLLSQRMADVASIGVAYVIADTNYDITVARRRMLS
jgi:hypothetical protein